MARERCHPGKKVLFGTIKCGLGRKHNGMEKMWPHRKLLFFELRRPKNDTTILSCWSCRRSKFISMRIYLHFARPLGLPQMPENMLINCDSLSNIYILGVWFSFIHSWVRFVLAEKRYGRVGTFSRYHLIIFTSLNEPWSPYWMDDLNGGIR